MASKRRKANNDSISFDDMLSLVATGLKNSKPNHLQYKPHRKQRLFHESQANGRLFLGGNRSGKTVAGINEDIMWARGKHPNFDLPPPPIIGRIVTVDFKNGADKIIIPQLRQWIPPSELINGSWDESYNGRSNILTLANASEIEIMSHEQELDKFAGVPRHWIHFDEEPPKDIWEECKARLVDYNGRWWITMTPVEGMTWSYDEIWEKRENGLIEVIQVHQDDNIYLNEKGRQTLQEGYTDDEYDVRAKGDYVALSGLVFKHFTEDLVIPTIVPPAQGWVHWVSLDAGYNNPTAVLFHAVNNVDGTIITYKEHYRSEWTVQQHAERILEIEHELLEDHGVIPFLRVADPAIRQRQQTTGHSIQIEYALNKVNLALSATKDVNAGLDKMNNYDRLGKWFITEDCPNLIREKRRYQRGEYATARLRAKNNKKEEPRKKDDHAIDSTRYFFSFMPDLSAAAPTPATIERPNLLGAPTRKIGGAFNNNVDLQLLKSPKAEEAGEYPVIMDDYSLG